MASNLNGAVAGITQDHLEFANFPSQDVYSNEWSHTNITPIDSYEQPHQVYQPFPPSFPSYSYQEAHNSPSQHHSQYQSTIASSYYQPNTIPEVPYEDAYQSQQYPTQPNDFIPYYHPATVPSQYHNNDFAQDYQSTPAYHGLSPLESPMQRMQHLAQQQYGGTLAAQSAAAAAEDAAQAARRISPQRGKRAGSGETVRDVLHRQYMEQRKREEMQQMQQLQLQVTPIHNPAGTLQSQNTHSSIPTHSCVPPSDPPTPTTPTTPIFTFPLVSPPFLPSDRTPPFSGDANSSSGNSTLSQYPDDSQQAMVSWLKKHSTVASLQRSSTATAEGGQEALSGAPYQADTVVQSLEERAVPPSLSSTRKRPLDDSDCDHSEPELKPGMRREVNEKGETVDRLYVLVHHCNHNDPDYKPEGVVMPYEEYKNEEKRDDMITFSYSSVATPYEYVDFRVKKQEDAQEKWDAVSQP